MTKEQLPDKYFGNPLWLWVSKVAPTIETPFTVHDMARKLLAEDNNRQVTDAEYESLRGRVRNALRILVRTELLKRESVPHPDYPDNCMISQFTNVKK